MTRRWRTVFFGAILLGAFEPRPARADQCEFYRKFLPSIYEVNCTGGRKMRSYSGSGSASVADSFNINPGSLPTQPSPYGLEVIASQVRNPFASVGFNFSVIKGFHKIGTGISTASNNTFYGNDVVQRATGPNELTTLDPPEEAESSLPNLNLGTSFQLMQPEGKLETSLALGVSTRYNHITNTLGGGAGLFLTSNLFNAGFGIVHEKPSHLYGGINYFSGTLGAKLFLFEVEYTVLWNGGGPRLPPVQIATVTLNLGKLLLTGAERWLYYVQDGHVAQRHLAIQFQFSSHVSAGYLFNYIPGANSLAAQFYL